MGSHLERELLKLKKKIFALSAVVEEVLHKTTTAIQELDRDLAREVIHSDQEVDRLEVEVEEECLKALALYQPVATDLRFIVSVLKLNNDLERISDHAVNIAERVEFLASQEFVFPPAIPQMMQAVQAMLRAVLIALVDVDVERAEDVRVQDDEVDRLHKEMFEYVQSSAATTPHSTNHMSQMIALLDISRFLERIADHCTNIAEDVIFMNSGQIVRHSPRPESVRVPAITN